MQSDFDNQYHSASGVNPQFASHTQGQVQGQGRAFPADRLVGDIGFGQQGHGSGYNSLNFDIWRLLRAVFKWWWLIAFIIASAIGGTLYFLSHTTPMFKSASTLEIKRSERQVISTTEIDKLIADQEFLETQLQLLKSRSVAAKVVEALGLQNDSDFASVGSVTQQSAIREATFVVMDNMDVSLVGGSRLIRVSFIHKNNEKAALVVNTITEQFIASNVNRKFDATSFARSFLEEQLATTKSALENSERELVDYASSKGIINIGATSIEGGGETLDATALSTLNAELTDAKTIRISSQKLYQRAQNQEAIPQLQNNKILLDLKAKKRQLSTEYQNKLAIFKPSFPDMVELQDRLRTADADVEREIQSVIASLKTYYDTAVAREQNLLIRTQELKASLIDLKGKSIGYNILKREVDTNRGQYDALLQRLKEVNISDELGSDLVSIVDPALAPRKPFKPDRNRSLLIALLLSALLGTAIVVLIDIIDDRVAFPDDVKSGLRQPLLGVVPTFSKKKNIVDVLHDPQSELAESYSAVRTNLKYAITDNKSRTILLTSTRSGEGKSVSSLGLALRFAGLNEKTLIIDADMRNPSFLRDSRSKKGLSELLSSSDDPLTYIQSANVENLDLLPSGGAVPNPSELLASARMLEILNYAKQHYKYVIIDSPPVLGLADAPTLGAICDMVILVVHAGKIRKLAVRATIERLRNSGTNIAGVLLTQYKSQSTGYMDYYRYSYGNDAKNYGKQKSAKGIFGRKKDRKLDLG